MDQVENFCASNRIKVLQYQLSTVVNAIQHEDNLINHRLGWLWAIQGALFAGYAFTFDKKVLILGLVLCFFGVVSALSVRLICDAAAETLEVLLGRKNVIAQEMDGGTKTEALYFDPPALERVRMKYQIFVPWRFLPVMFIAAWLFLGAYVGLLRLGYLN